MMSYTGLRSFWLGGTALGNFSPINAARILLGMEYRRMLYPEESRIFV